MQPRYESFTWRVNREERQMLAELARRLQRNQADTLRLLVREALLLLIEKEQSERQSPPGQEVHDDHK